ncbi:MAG: hypothetical protein JSU81_06130 [Candidatus Coatesbacteria bacterium]|nr:MAG: hypothetical protein JSU81_06130 [Candidatus Coatesbacteria bacterium]
MASYVDLIRLAGPVGIAAAAVAAAAVVVAASGYVLAFTVGRRRPRGRAMRVWEVSALAVGALGLIVGVGGTLVGGANFVRGGASSSLFDVGVAAAGLAQICVCPVAGSLAVALALFGYGTVRLLVAKYE